MNKPEDLLSLQLCLCYNYFWFGAVWLCCFSSLQVMATTKHFQQYFQVELDKSKTSCYFAKSICKKCQVILGFICSNWSSGWFSVLTGQCAVICWSLLMLYTAGMWNSCLPFNKGNVKYLMTWVYEGGPKAWILTFMWTLNDKTVAQTPLQIKYRPDGTSIPWWRLFLS